MSSFDKIVKGACKPKPAPPKAKYLDPIIAATWSEDGAVYDVCKALVPRLREPNAIVVFKALIVLHIMIRNGATDNVLSHLSSSEVLRLRNVSAGNWEGYNAPQNMQHYALYLDSRIRAYRELNHDAIRVQAESNRDLRLHNSIEEDNAYPTVPPPKVSSTKSKAPQRSKTIMGRKLRVMTVEKGLLRETKTVQKMIDTLVECRFYLDDLEDELTIAALRMLVKDLLILFQACNEGVINVLEHYFEMSKYDAEEALCIYRYFCDQTERVVEYLGVARKLQNLLNVPIPHLNHAPVSLASSLQDYLNDPNFEQNRLEYKASKERNIKGGNDASSAQVPKGTCVVTMNSTTAQTSLKPPSLPLSGADSKPEVNHAKTDFFDSIEEKQVPIFNPVTGSPPGNQFHQMTAHNPFIRRQITGAPPSHPFVGQVQAQNTGFPSAFPAQFAQSFQPTQPLHSSQVNNFAFESQQLPQHHPFSTFIPQRATGLQLGPATRPLQAQSTGVNPFRQSMLILQATGMAAFHGSGIAPVPPLPVTQTGFPLQTRSDLQSRLSGPLTAQFPQVQPPVEVPARPASTPLTTVSVNPSSVSPPIAQPVKTHQTGSRNPFGVPVIPAPPVPKPPTLAELSMGVGQLGTDGSQPISQFQPTLTSGSPIQSTITTTTESTFSTVASSFTFTSRPEGNPPYPSSDLNRLSSHFDSQMALASTTSSVYLSSLPFQPTSSTASSHAPSIPVTGPLKPQPTGFGGVKPFKPTSSFGASLLESLPPVPQSGAATPEPSAQTTTHSSNSSPPTNLALNGSVCPSSAGNDSSMLWTWPTGVSPPSQRLNGGSTVGAGLRPQVTGAPGAVNPFRATMFAATSAPPIVSGVPSTLAPSASTPPFGGLSNGTGGPPVFSSGSGTGRLGLSFTHLGQERLNTQQQHVRASLI